MKKVISIIAIITIVISLIAGCARSSDDTSAGTDNTSNIPRSSINLPDVVYTSEIIGFPELPDGMTIINNVALNNEKVYFTAYGDEQGTSKFNPIGIFTMDIDGSNLTALPNYIPESFPAHVINGGIILSAIHVDNEGFIWVAEYRGSTGNDGSTDYIGSSIRKLDETGAEILSYDLNNIISSNDPVYVTALCVDTAGNIYMASFQNIFVLDNRENLLFTLESNDFLANFVLLSDRSVAFITLQDGNIYMKKIDTESKAWGSISRLPSNVPRQHSVFSGTEEYEFLYNDDANLNGVENDTGDSIKLLSWADSSFAAIDITGIMLLPDGRIAATRQRLGGTGQLIFELVLLTETSLEELADKTILTMATYDYWTSRNEVEAFNRTSKTHHIHVIDYSQYGDFNTAFQKLSTEIIAGNIPDILDFTRIPIHDYISKSVLIDLYPFIDADPELSRSSIVESLLNITEVDGSLYYLVPSFTIRTIIGNPQVLGSYPGWNIEELAVVLDENPQADMPLGSFVNKTSALSDIFSISMDEFVDFKSGTANFDSEKFVELLEFVNRFPSELNDTIGPFELIMTGRQIIDWSGSFFINDYPMYRHLFGGDIVFKGLPVENRDGNALRPSKYISITSGCADPEAAWEFVRLFLLEEFQRDLFPFLFPANRAVLDERLDELLIPHDPQGLKGASDGFTSIEIDNPDISQAEVKIIKDIIDNISHIYHRYNPLQDLINETTADFFNGRITAQDAARIIQNRASIYLSEQTG